MFVTVLCMITGKVIKSLCKCETGCNVFSFVFNLCIAEVGQDECGGCAENAK